VVSAVGLALATGGLTTMSASAQEKSGKHGKAHKHGRQDPSLSIRGADLGFALQEEVAGTTYRDLRGRRGSPESILADYGANWIRLRVWTNPPEGYSTLGSALRMAKKAARQDMKILLNLHYADFWADPGKQPVPEAWAGQDLATLSETVRRYTRDAVRAFARQGTPVDMVQVGNEVTNGMLHPVGELYPPGQPQRWTEFTTLLKAGIKGAKEGAPWWRQPKIMIHIDRGGDNGGSRWFMDNILSRGVQFDVLGESYYPIWHGSLADLENNLDDLATRYEQDLVVVETAYPWTAGDGDGFPNLWGGTPTLPDQATYPVTPFGQAAFFEELRRIILEVPQDRGLGFFTFEPSWLTVGWEPGAGAPNDNLTQFDWDGNALPSVLAYRPADRRWGDFPPYR
jgi:arabinogalactan endo-1,4-beta-galactosidase